MSAVRVRAVLFLLCLQLSGSSHAGAQPLPPGRAGTRYPAERTVYLDSATGRRVTRLTASSAEDVKIYQTHPSWTADGRWIVFGSNRTGSSQLFAVDEASGTIVQLTDEPEVNTAQACLSRRRAELWTVVGRQIVRLDLSSILTPPEPVQTGAERRDLRTDVGAIPEGAALCGTMSLDASEGELFLGLEHADRPEPRRWSIAALDLDTGALRTVIDLGFRVGHVQANPVQSGWIMYCHETGGDAAQRMWVIRADGTSNKPFYRETFDEWVTHEVWWDTERALFTVWPKDAAMRRKPHGIASVSLNGEVTFHSRFPYWHVTGAQGSRYAVADTFDGSIFRVDLVTGERVLWTRGHRLERRGAHPHPTMHSDGKRVLFNSNAGGSADLYLVRLDDESPAVEAARGETPPLRTRRYRSGTAQEARSWQKELRSRLMELLALEDLAGKRPALAPRVIRSEAKETYTIREVEISSTPGRRIPLLLTVPRPSRRPQPAVVCIHGHGGNRRVVHDPASIYKGFASVLAASGMVTISADVGQHEVYEDGRTLMGERVWDLMRSIDYLETLPEVDRKRIGCAGLSLGGEMAMWLGALDERVQATVSSGFLTTMDQMEVNHCMCWKFDGLRELVDFADIYALTAPRALQCQNGRREDPTQFWVPIARQAMRDVKRIYADLDAPANARLLVHDGAHEIALPALRSFLEEHLRAGN